MSDKDCSGTTWTNMLILFLNNKNSPRQMDVSLEVTPSFTMTDGFADNLF